MRNQLPLFFALFVFLLLAGCGDQTGTGLSSADVAYIRAKRLQEAYGTVNGTTTATSTVSSVVTITSVTTSTFTQ
jgi:hypothetical protein